MTADTLFRELVHDAERLRRRTPVQFARLDGELHVAPFPPPTAWRCPNCSAAVYASQLDALLECPGCGDGVWFPSREDGYVLFPRQDP